MIHLADRANHKHDADATTAVERSIRVQDDRVIYEPNSGTKANKSVNLVQYYDQDTGDVHTNTSQKNEPSDKWSKKNQNSTADV